MIYKKLILICLAVCFFISALKAQNNEPIILKTDRNSYISGDEILFSIIFPQNCSIDTIPGTDVMVDIVDNDGKLVLGVIVKQEHAFANGMITVPDTLPTNFYNIRAYTKYPNIVNYFCNKQILITNRFGKSDDYILIDSRLSNAEKSSSNIINIPKTNFKRKEILPLSFNLHDTLNSIICVVNKQQWEQEYECWSGKTEEFNINDSAAQITPYNGVFISGTLVDAETLKPIPNAIVFVSMQDSTVRLRYDVTDDDGVFCTSFYDYYGVQQIFINAFNKKLEPYKNVKIELNNQFNNIVNSTPQLSEKSIQLDSVELNKSIITKAFEIQPFTLNVQDNRPKLDYSHYLVGNVANSVQLADYVPFNDFAEITREVLPFIRLRKDKQGNPEMRIVTNFELKNIVNANPFVLVDGVPLCSLVPLLGCGSSIIKKVDTQNKPRFFGNIGFENGIVLVWTNKTDFWQRYKVDGTYTFDIQCFQPRLSQSRGNKPEGKIPDFRQVLYWNPQVSINANSTIEIPLSDELGEFVIEILAIDKNGKIYTDYKTINVK